MAAVDMLPAFAEDQDWVVDDRGADWFGDVRVFGRNGFGDEVRMVFAADGSLSGGYMSLRDGTEWHTERVTVLKGWLQERNGVMA